VKECNISHDDDEKTKGRNNAANSADELMNAGLSKSRASKLEM
jgi:hypothetical protein